MTLRARFRRWCFLLTSHLLPSQSAQVTVATTDRRRDAPWTGFLRSTHGGATGIVAGTVTVVTIGAAAFIADHLWLIDQRDTLKSATDAATVAATMEMSRLVEADHTVSDDDLKNGLKAVARPYIELNLGHFSADRLARAKQTLAIEAAIDRGAGSVQVTAEADLGGTLFTRALPLFDGSTGPGAMRASTTVECAANAIEVVLALDVTASMHGAIDTSLPARGDNRRLNAAVKAAKALVEELRSTCDESTIAVGVVPWDKTVRLPSADTWRRERWVEVGSGRLASLPSDWSLGSDWEGCVEDREHDANPLDATALASAASMSLVLPATSPFPAFIYPDTRDFSVTSMANDIKTDFPDLTDEVKDALVTRLEELRDNDWGRQERRGTGGSNSNCTSTEMLPLTTTLTTVNTALDGIKTGNVWGGGTMAHLGVTWGRRMLAHSWRTVWGSSDSVHPINPDDSQVTKVLILLTDGGNSLEDRQSELPGRLHAKHVDVPDCLDTAENPPSSCRQGDIGTFYSALGRLGPGPGETNDKVQGYYYPGWGVRGTTGGGSKTTETALSALMKRSCALARDEGITIYTIGAMPRVHDRWRNALVACSGAPGIADANRSAFYFEAADNTSLEGAFRAIAHRILTFRRVT